MWRKAKNSAIMTCCNYIRSTCANFRVSNCCTKLDTSSQQHTSPAASNDGAPPLRHLDLNHLRQHYRPQHCKRPRNMNEMTVKQLTKLTAHRPPTESKRHEIQVADGHTLVKNDTPQLHSIHGPAPARTCPLSHMVPRCQLRTDHLVLLSLHLY